jgi:hypothetical protein
MRIGRFDFESRALAPLLLASALACTPLSQGAGGKSSQGAGGKGSTSVAAATGSTSSSTSGSASSGSAAPMCGTCPVFGLCDAALGCVQCLKQSDCPSSMSCVAGHCVQCAVDTDCASPPTTCDTVQHMCLLPCNTDNDCVMMGTGESFCRTSTHSCVRCRSASDCSAGLQCDAQAGTCVECASSANCSGSRPYCDVFRGVCVACLSNAACPPGSSCTAGTCGPDCTIANLCMGLPNLPYCDTGSGQCVQCIPNGPGGPCGGTCKNGMCL